MRCLDKRKAGRYTYECRRMRRCPRSSMDRAPGFGPGGCGFESCRGRPHFRGNTRANKKRRCQAHAGYARRDALLIPRASASLRRSSVPRCGWTAGWLLATVPWQNCWPSAAVSGPLRWCAGGARSSASRTPMPCAVASRDWATSDTVLKRSSRFTARSTIGGATAIRTAPPRRPLCPAL